MFLCFAVGCLVYCWVILQVSCAANSENEIFDLSSLTLLNRSHPVSISPSISDSETRSATFFINICHPVSQQDAANCPLDAAVCRKDAASTVVSSSDAVCKCQMYIAQL